MEKFVFLLKTFKNDFIYVRRLLNTFQKYNEENIQMYIVMPSADEHEFKNSTDLELLKNCHFICEETFSAHLAEGFVNNIRPGYINQEIIKIAFWEAGVTENYLPVDSDGEFIRPFFLNDFIAEDGNPYSVLIEDNELKVDPVYYNECGWAVREERIRKIFSAIGYESRVMLTAHGFCIISCKVLEDLHEKFMKPHSYSYINLLEICPYEFSWYNMWLQKSGVIPLHIREPLFKYFHTRDQLVRCKQQGVTLADLARGYVGIVVNSNFQPNRGEDNPINYNTFVPPPVYIDPGIKACMKIIKGRLARKIVRRIQRTWLYVLFSGRKKNTGRTM